jgi:hypothetical protein
MGIEPTTYSLATNRSTAELVPQKEAIGSLLGARRQAPDRLISPFQKGESPPFSLVAQAFDREHAGGPPRRGDGGDSADQQRDPDGD